MSKLTENLNRIYDFLESINPNSEVYELDTFNYGLTDEQIRQAIKDLPFDLSEEVFELYRWRNGYDDSVYNPARKFLFPEQLRQDISIEFLSLNDSIGLYNILSEDASGEYWTAKWFPIGAFEFNRILYVVGDLNPSPVFLWDTDAHPHQVRMYKDLSSMISVIAECCELNLYIPLLEQFKRRGENEFTLRIRIDESKLELEKAIFQKYNS
jgi:hypothetical protein